MKTQGGAGAGCVRSTCYVTEFPFSTGTRGGGGFFPVSVSVPLPRPPACLPAFATLCTLSLSLGKPGQSPRSHELWERVGGGRGEERCWEGASKEVTSGCGLRLRLGTYVYVQTTGLRRLCLLGLIESVGGGGEIATNVSPLCRAIFEEFRCTCQTAVTGAVPQLCGLAGFCLRSFS